MRNTLIWILLGFLQLPVFFAAVRGGDDPPQSFLLESNRQPGQIDRVVAVLEIAGERLVKGDHGVQRIAVSGVANLSYDEKTLAAGPEGRARSVRWYEKAAAQIEVAEQKSERSLRPERSLIAVVLDADKPLLFSPRGELNSDELSLIGEVPGNTLALDEVLPGRPAAVGETWTLSEKTVAALLDIDQIRAARIECRLKEATPELARIELSGEASGTANGAACRLEVKGKCRFDRRRGRIDWFAMLINDRRDPCDVEDGMDVKARLQIKISPTPISNPLGDAALRSLPLDPTPELCRILYEGADGSWQLKHDRQWFLCESRRDAAVLRLMAQGTDVAQCNIAPLARVSPEKLPELADFQEDVRRALGKNFGGFVEAAQLASEVNYRIYRVVAKGDVDSVPIQWQYYLLADERGRRVAATFTVKESNLDAFDKAGEQLIRAIRFVEKK